MTNDNDKRRVAFEAEASFTGDIFSREQTQNHPELENLYFIDRLGNKYERINANGKPIEVDNELITGQLLIMVRTCDADAKEEPEVTGGSVSNDVISNYFRKKKRRFEIQYQIKFKKIPDSQIYLSIEYDEPVSLNFLSRTSVGAAMKFVKMKNPTFSYSLSGKETTTDEDKEKGNYENPHFAFPIETSLDRIVITKEGDLAPILGGTIEEDPEARKEWKDNRINYNTNDTYTLCLYSAYIDFPSWKAVNLPAVPQFSLARVNDAQPISVKLYSLKSNNDKGKHLQKDLETILDVEVSHHDATIMGEGAKRWMNKSINFNEDDSCSMSYHTAIATIGTIEEERRQKKCCCIC